MTDILVGIARSGTPTVPVAENILPDNLREPPEFAGKYDPHIHDLESAPDYFDWLVLLNVRVIADGPFAPTFTPENLSRTYGGRTHVLSRLDQEAAAREAREIELRI